MKLWLHVGAHKTGTTALQDNMWRARERLAERGIIYPTNVTGVDFKKRQHFTHNFLFDAMQKNVLGETLDAITAYHGNGVYFISAEGFSQIQLHRRWRLADPVKFRFDPITVLVYVRDPASYVVSRASQKLQHGRTMDEIVADPPVYSYRAEIESWWSHFGRENVIVRPYGVKETTADVLDVIGLPQDTIPERNWRNTRPSAEAIEAIRTARARGETRKGMGTIPGRPFTLPDEIVDRAVEAAQDDLRWLKDTFGITLPTEHFVDPVPETPENADARP